MMPKLNLAEQRFGKLVAKAVVGQHHKGEYLWWCWCDCGNEVAVQSGSLRHGTKSCGCLQREACSVIGRQNRTHGMKGTPAHRSWMAMNGRCRNIHDKDYGGRGIRVCERWNSKNPDGFVNFRADMGERPPGMSIGRFGDMGNYEPGNCKWMTPKEQQANRRQAHRAPKHLRNGDVLAHSGIQTSPN
jgi:hypothetical protein